MLAIFSCQNNLTEERVFFVIDDFIKNSTSLMVLQLTSSQRLSQFEIIT